MIAKKLEPDYAVYFFLLLKATSLDCIIDLCLKTDADRATECEMNGFLFAVIKGHLSSFFYSQ